MPEDVSLDPWLLEKRRDRRRRWFFRMGFLLVALVLGLGVVGDFDALVVIHTVKSGAVSAYETVLGVFTGTYRGIDRASDYGPDENPLPLTPKRDVGGKVVPQIGSPDWSSN